MYKLDIKNESNIEEISNQIASVINRELLQGKKVLLFLTGGSSIPMQIMVSKKIENISNENLVITLTDERYGENNHKDSNWFKLISGGFIIKGAKLFPVLSNKSILETTEDFTKTLEEELKKADYRIGLFGIGADAHIAGILPQSIAVNTNEFACNYDAPPFLRITITPKTILKLDQAFVYAMGENKWPIIESFKDELLIKDYPVQVLKRVPLLTIFTDKK